MNQFVPCSACNQTINLNDLGYHMSVCPAIRSMTQMGAGIPSVPTGQQYGQYRRVGRPKNQVRELKTEKKTKEESRE